MSYTGAQSEKALFDEGPNNNRIHLSQTSICSRKNRSNPFEILQRLSMTTPVPHHIENIIMRKDEKRRRREKDTNSTKITHHSVVPSAVSDLNSQKHLPSLSPTTTQIHFLQRLRQLASSSFEE